MKVKVCYLSQYSNHKTKMLMEKVFEEVVYGYDVIIKKNKKIKIKFKYNALDNLTSESLDNNIELDDNCIIFSVNDSVTKGILVDLIWTKYIINIISEYSIVVSDLFIEENYNINYENYFNNILKITKDAARGIIMKNYSHLSNSKIVELVRLLYHRNCDIIKEDETFITSTYSLLERISRITHYQDKIYVFNSLSCNTQVCNRTLLKNNFSSNIILSPLVMYLLNGFSRLYEWYHKGYPVWGHRQGYELIGSKINKKVYLKLALLAGATFLHVGTPRNESELYNICKLIKDLKKIRNFIPVYTGIEDKRIEDILLSLSDGHAIFLSPIYQKGCDK